MVAGLLAGSGGSIGDPQGAPAIERNVADTTKQRRTHPPLSMRGRVKFEMYGDAMIEKKVKLSGNSGRVYLPVEWVNSHVKIIRID